MDPAVAASAVPEPPVTFEDGLGERRYTIGAGNRPLEVLRLSSALSGISSFEFALRERAGRLANFRHQSYGCVRAVEVDKLTSALVVVSDYVPGVRLSTLLAAAEKRSHPLDIDAARSLIRQLVWAVAAWQETVPDVCHGAIGPERMIVTREGRLMIVEYVLGAALEQLRYSREQYWRRLRVALPDAIGPLFDSRVDVTQVGAVALALILGRPLSGDEYPDQIEEVVGVAADRLAAGGLESLSAALREWLLRALQLDPNRPFVSANEARVDLAAALGSQDLAVELGALRAFVAGCAVRDMADGAPIALREAPAVDPPSRSRQVVGTDPALPPPVARHDAAASTPDGGDVDGVSDIDLAARIEALKSFLARYPSRSPTDEPPAKPGVTSPDVAAPDTSPASPAPRIQPVAESQVDDALPLDRAAGSRVLLQSQPYEWTSAPPVGLLGSPRRRMTAGIALAVIIAGLVLAGLPYLPSAGNAATGALSVDTNPPGIAVLIDGTLYGVTPLSVNLPPGDHVVELVAGSERRRIPVSIAPGGQVSQFLELPRVSSEFGELLVRTDAPRVSVTVDGRPVGQAPLTVQDLTPGVHTVVLQHGSGTVTEQVLIESGRTASLVVSMASSPDANAAGWISISAPAEVQVYENERLLGSSRINRIMLPVGRHELEIVNESLGYRAVHAVHVTGGQVAPIRLQWPQGTLAVNAIPWAEVWIDDELMGETPIGSISIPIGVHEIVFRHPELGERRASVTVTVGKTTTIGVDLRAK